MDAYRVLGVTGTATRAEIRAAYRARARQLHPDVRRGPDGSVPARAQAAWLELTEALHAALAAAAAVPTLPTGLVPGQRRTTAQQRPVAQRPVAQRPVASRDPMLALLTLPRECRESWSSEELEVWALTLVPAARRHLARAREVVADLRLRHERHRAAATVHVLLTVTLTESSVRRLRVLAHRLPSAYAALERQLPASVVDTLPLQAGAGRPRPAVLSLPWRR